MTNHYISRDEILDAIARVHVNDTYPPADNVSLDGTYRIVPTWVGPHRVWMAQAIIELSGYEIAHRPVADGAYWYPLEETRFGYWKNPESGEVCLDETIHVRGNFNVALELGAQWRQDAIWEWSTSRAWDVA